MILLMGKKITSRSLKFTFCNPPYYTKAEMDDITYTNSLQTQHCITSMSREKSFLLMALRTRTCRGIRIDSSARAVSGQLRGRVLRHPARPGRPGGGRHQVRPAAGGRGAVLGNLSRYTTENNINNILFQYSLFSFNYFLSIFLTPCEFLYVYSGSFFQKKLFHIWGKRRASLLCGFYCVCSGY